MHERLPYDLLDDFIQRHLELRSLLRLKQTCRFFRDRASIQSGILNKLRGIQTHLIPSSSVIAERKKNGNDNATIDIYMTRDNIQLGCQLMICFEITNRDVLHRFHNVKDLRDFIVNIVKCSVGRAIQSYTSMDFMRGANRQQLLDPAKENLNKDFSDYSIRLLRLQFELVKLVDVEHTKKMHKLP